MYIPLHVVIAHVRTCSIHVHIHEFIYKHYRHSNNDITRCCEEQCVVEYHVLYVHVIAADDNCTKIHT